VMRRKELLIFNVEECWEEAEKLIV
jgi:hypothetical protein